MIAQVIHIGSGGDHIDFQLAQQPGEPPVELALAEVTAVGLITKVVGIGKFLGADHPVANPNAPGEILGFLELTGGQAIGNSRHGNCGIAKGLVSCLGDNRAVNSSGIRNGHPAVTLQGVEQLLTPGDQ